MTLYESSSGAFAITHEEGILLCLPALCSANKPAYVCFRFILRLSVRP